MKPLQALALEDPHWSLEELVQVANEQLPQFLPEEKAHTRVREDVTPRLIRHYASQRMLDEPLKAGREARYLYRHLLQLLLVRRLLAEGYGASAIDKLAISKTNQELEELLQGGVQLTITPANLALAFLQQVQQRQTPPMQSLPSLPSTPPPPVAPVPVPPSALAPPSSTQWTRVEVLPGLELHIRHNFVYPSSGQEQQSLLQLIRQILFTFGPKRRASK
ncbi:MerR family transcriptional regulator [Leptolyngbya sp. FACHB-321]|uniref:MerR family transcriptional regulator n=1 Tax=Leptolyngbya sp. FACHB-321 TaxID=2692807 RepID=UPI0016853559|nr:MerR family transcriptional regulator [Leptolyngbya sp. FACHB-321]MBD2036167.1 MerR family transcriptional regulator [Leptolyngbya sp. FACHB-321]